MIYKFLHVIDCFYVKFADYLLSFSLKVYESSDSFDNFVGCYGRGDFKLKEGLKELFKGEL